MKERCLGSRRLRCVAAIVLALFVVAAGGVVLDVGGNRASALNERDDDGGYEYEEPGGTGGTGGDANQSPPSKQPETFTIYGQPASGGDYGPYGSGATAYRTIGPCHTDGPNELLELPASDFTRIQDVVRTNGSARVVIFSSDEKHTVVMTIKAASLLPGTATVGIISSTGNLKGMQGCNRSSGLTSRYVETWSQARYMYVSRPTSPGGPGEDSLVMRSRDYFVWWSTGFPDIFSWDPDTFWGLASGNLVEFDWIRD